jgi:hypothetical protein
MAMLAGDRELARSREVQGGALLDTGLASPGKDC